MAELISDETDEQVAVFAKRFSDFLDLGYTATEAELLAHTDHVSWHDLRRLIAQGCDPLTAARILI